MIEKLRNSFGVSAVVLVVTNTLPLLCVLFFDWQVFFLIALYWMENVVIGVLNIFRFVTILVRNKAWDAILMIPFFTVHYGMFTGVHGFFVIAMFGKEFQKTGDDLLLVLPAILEQPGMKIAAIGFLGSHLFSYFYHFIGKEEYRKATTQSLMSAPYKRVVILHLTILFGGFLVLSTGEHLMALVLMVVIKMVMDLLAHTKEHSSGEEEFAEGNFERA